MNESGEAQPSFGEANQATFDALFWEIVEPLRLELADPLADQAGSEQQASGWRKAGSIVLGGLVSAGALFSGAAVSAEIARQITNFWPRS